MPRNKHEKRRTDRGEQYAGKTISNGMEDGEEKEKHEGLGEAEGEEEREEEAINKTRRKCDKGTQIHKRKEQDNKSISILPK